MDSGTSTPISTSTAPTTQSHTPNPKTVICVFCGSSPGKSPAYMAAARDLAQALHRHNISLCYGGGTVGLMGEVARNLVALSGPESVHGIIPAPLVKYEQGPSSTTVAAGLPKISEYGRTTVVKDMHTRKQMMADEVIRGGPGSGFVALPGGYGTLEELAEIVTWNQLGIHGRGVVVLNVEGYWDGIMKWVETSVESGFVQETNKGIIREATDGESAIQELAQYQSAEGRFKLSWGEH